MASALQIPSGEERAAFMKRFLGSRASTAVLYAAFAATGVGLVLPGTLLPQLLERWSMGDSKAGALLFVFSCGSILGALISRGSLVMSAARGCLTAAFGLVGIGYATASWVFPATAVFGCGLGLVMTSVSMLVVRCHAADRAAQLSRLNLIWGIGACCGPWLLLRKNAHADLPMTLYVLVALFLLLAAAVPAFVRSPSEAKQQTATPMRTAQRRASILLAMVPLATGVESAVGGWLSTFAKRSGESLSGTIAATTCLWAGLLLSRGALSNKRIAAACSGTLPSLGPVLISSALTLMLLSRGRSGVPVGAFVLGVGIGPMYPALLARVLRGREASTAAFALAGVGASTLPLLTGLVSSWRGSLRAGLCVPLAAAAVMLGCGLRVRTESVQEEVSS